MQQPSVLPLVVFYIAANAFALFVFWTVTSAGSLSESILIILFYKSIICAICINICNAFHIFSYGAVQALFCPAKRWGGLEHHRPVTCAEDFRCCHRPGQCRTKVAPERFSKDSKVFFYFVHVLFGICWNVLSWEFGRWVYWAYWVYWVYLVLRWHYLWVPLFFACRSHCWSSRLKDK
jgi:hypothetical protein